MKVENINLTILISLALLVHHHTSAYRGLSTAIRKATSLVKKSHSVDQLQQWSRTELSELANIFAEKLLNDPKFGNFEFVEQSASKYYVDVDSLDPVFQRLETDGLALRTRIYEDIRRADLLDDKGEIKEVLRVAPIFKEMSQRERDNLRITDQKVIAKIQPKNLIKHTKLSTTPRRLKTVGDFLSTKNNDYHQQSHGNGTAEKRMWTARKITTFENAKLTTDDKAKLENELAIRDVEISDLKRNGVQDKMKIEQLSKALEKKELELAIMKNQQQRQNTAAAQADVIRVKTVAHNAKLETKERELYNLDRKISMKMHQLQNIESKISGTTNAVKTVQFAVPSSTILHQRVTDEQKLEKQKNDQNAVAAARMIDDEAVVIKAPRQIRTLSKRSRSKTVVPDQRAAADLMRETENAKAPKRIVTMNKRKNKSVVIPATPTYEADTENVGTVARRLKTFAAHGGANVGRRKTTIGNGSAGAVEILSPPWAHQKKN